MRRLIASLGLLAFANLAFVPLSGACPLSGELSHGAHVAAPTSEHAGHAMPDSSGHKAVQEHPAEHGPVAPDCLMVGQCTLTVDIGRVAVATTATVRAGRVITAADDQPSSRTPAPETPPPRA